MRRYRLKDLDALEDGHVFSRILKGKYLDRGGIGFKQPGDRSHSGASAADLHTHADEECFVFLQGKAEIEINGKLFPVAAGDVVVVEPGEDHHIISDELDPCVNIWIHAGDAHHTTKEKMK